MATRSRQHERARILFIQPGRASFIDSDLELLRRHFEVRHLYLGSFKRSLGGKLRVAMALIKGVLWSDLTYSWFVDVHAKWAVRLSSMLGRGSVVVLGGYEVAKVPEINHGSLLNPKLAKVVKYVLERADRVLTVDDSLKAEAMKELGVSGSNIMTVLAGHDSELFKPTGPKENMVLTIGLLDKPVVKRKGLDVFVRAAGLVPGAKFVLIGSGSDGYEAELRKMAAPNVEFVGWVDHDDLVKYYQRAKVYCQLSISEGLPRPPR
jgi:glycosyltransferase involved in cell wall biosynthesis